MELNVKLSKHDFMSMRRGVLRANRLRLAVSICIQVCLWLWMLLPFVQLLLMGIEAQVPFAQVLQAYPSFMVDRGYLSPGFFVCFVAFLCCTPLVLAWLTSKRAYAAYQRIPRSIVVLSEWRLCLYDQNKQLLSAIPYHMIDRVLWLRHSITVVLRSGDCFGISTRGMSEELVETVLDTLSTYRELDLDLLCCPDPVPLAQPALWQSNLTLQRADFVAAGALLVVPQQRTGRKLLALLLLLLVLQLLLNALSLMTLILVALIGWMLYLILPRSVARRAARAAKRRPWVLTMLSGEVTITEDGLFRQNQLFYSHFSWNLLEQVIADHTGVLLTSQGRIAAFLPARCFEDSAQMERFARWLELKIQKKKADGT